MQFSYLKELHQNWKQLQVIGRTFTYNNPPCHIIGMTLTDKATLYILETHKRISAPKLKGPRNNRRLMKEHSVHHSTPLQCDTLFIDQKQYTICGGQALPLRNMNDDPQWQLFFDMLSAGWNIPEWLMEADWEELSLISLEINELQTLPPITPQTTITLINNHPDAHRYLIEKPLSLIINKPKSFSFIDSHGTLVDCHINKITLFDVWETFEIKFNQLADTHRITPEELNKAKNQHFEMLAQHCPQGMCYIGIEYECTENYQLQFYTKEYLKTIPRRQKGSNTSMEMVMVPDHPTGTHQLPLKTCVLLTPLSPDTTKIAAELFCIYEPQPSWKITV